jgi:hypothetical protein
MTEDREESVDDNHDDGRRRLSGVEFSKLVREHQNEYIRVADNKASILLSGLVAYLGLSLTAIGSNYSSEGDLFLLAGSLSVISAIFSIYYAASAVYPHTPETPQGLVMWESITSDTRESYRKTIRSKDSEDLFNELIDENYKLAQVNDRKYQRVRRALLSAVPTVGFGILAMVLLAS